MRRVKLGDVTSMVGGGTPNKKEPSYWGGEIPWASVKDLKSDSLDSTIDSITPEGVSNSASRIIPAYSLIVSTRMTVGKAVINSIPVAINQDLKALTPSKDIKLNFLFYLFKSKANYFESVSTGATVKGIKIDHIKSLEVNLPPLLTQQRIAAKLDAIDRLRGLLRREIAAYGELGESLFLEMFGDPVLNKKKWSKEQLQVVCAKIVVGFVGTCEPFYTDASGVPMIRTGNLGDDSLKLDRLKYVTKSFHDKQKKSQLQKNDILIARHGDNGKAVIYDGRFREANCLNIVVLRPGNLVSGLYISYVLNSDTMRQYIASKTGGATQKVINTTQIKKLKIPLPPLPLQTQFAARIQQIEALKARAEVALAEADALFGAEMQGVFG